MAALANLPNEVLSIIAGHLGSPRDVLSLSLCNHRLFEYAKLDGWKSFLKGRFDLPGLELDACNTLHGLTTLYRNWDRKSFLARFLEPPLKVTSVNTWEVKGWRGPTGQTMGYQPSIDSYEELQGSWANRREVLAWSAGTHVVMRIKETGPEASMMWEDYQGMQSDSDESFLFDDYRHLNSWYTYRVPDSFEGRDDITALKLLRPHQTRSDYVTIAYGTASGKMTLLSVNAELKERKEQAYNTDRRPVSSLSISPDSRPLMAVTLSDSVLALYDTNIDNASDKAIDALGITTPIASGGRNGRLWSANFLAKDKVAVGIGPSHEPIQVFDVSSTGLPSEPLRKFSLEGKFVKGIRSDIIGRTNTSVYPIIPIAPSSSAGANPGDIFLSGGYDGIIRLHDMRSPNGFEARFWDVTNDSSIYSLATQGLERVIAGTSMHSMLKVFDLRFSGSHAYHHPMPVHFKPRQRSSGNLDIKAPRSPITGGWNVFLNPRNQVRHRQSRPSRTEDSPVYSLSIPSATSPSLYAGLEGTVMSLDFLSVTDKHPDPLFSQVVERFPDSGKVDLKRSYNPSDDVLNLGMYEQGDDQAVGMHLMVQEGIGMNVVNNARTRDQAKFAGLDERWKDPSADGGRWSRGQEPTRGTGHRGRGRGRGGRGRGRGQ